MKGKQGRMFGEIAMIEAVGLIARLKTAQNTA
jgi:hypothetical protein